MSQLFVKIRQGFAPSRETWGVWLAVAIVLIMAILAWYYQIGVGHVKAVLAPLQEARVDAPLLFAAGFFLLHVTLATLCVPLEIWMAVTAGALFGVMEGALLVSFGSAIGGTLAFSWSRFLLRERVKAWFPNQFQRVDDGIRRDGVLYLLTLRLLPVAPFGVVNVLTGLTAMKARTFYLVTQLSLLPAILLYVNAGTNLARIDSIGDILSPPLITALVLLALFPWAVKLVVAKLARDA